MIKKAINYSRWLFLLLLSIFIVNFIFFHIDPILINTIQQTSFFTNSLYFNTFLNYPGGIAEYIGTFVGAIYGVKTLGGIVISAMLIFTIIMFLLILSKTYKKQVSFLWIAIPAFLMLSLMQDYYFPPSVIVKILLLYVFIYLSIIIELNEYIKTFINTLLSLLIYYLLGSSILVVYLVSMFFFDLLNSKQNLIIIVRAAFYLILLFIVPYLGQLYFFNISQERTWTDLVPVLPPIIRYADSPFLNLFLYLLPLVILILSVLNIFEQKINIVASKIKFYSIICDYKLKSLLLFIIIAFSFIHLQNKKENLLQKQKATIDYCISHEKWNEAVNSAIESSENYDYFVNQDFNRAVYNAGFFADKILDYPQLLGSYSFYPDANASGQITIASSDFYYEIGYISEALHWAYEGLSILPWNQHILKRLVICNLIEGKTNAASTYLNVLKDVAWKDNFYDKYITYVSDTSLLTKDPEIAQKRAFMPHNSFIPNSITHKLKTLLNTNAQNKRALEYLAICYLLEHKIGDFMLLYPELQKLYPQKMPQIYELGAVLYCYNTDRNLLNQYNFSKETKSYFIHYSKTMKKYNNDKIAAQMELKDNYQNTYLYYLNYLSPVVTKMSIKKREVKN